MSFAILHDVEQGISVLIEPEKGHALGPIVAAGPHGPQLLEAFVAAIETDPAGLAFDELMGLWHRFISAMAEVRAPGAPLPPTGQAPAASTEPGSSAPTAANEPAAPPSASSTSSNVEIVAGPEVGSERAAPAGGSAVDPAEVGVPAVGSLPPSSEQAPPAGGVTVTEQVAPEIAPHGAPAPADTDLTAGAADPHPGT